MPCDSYLVVGVADDGGFQGKMVMQATVWTDKILGYLHNYKVEPNNDGMVQCALGLPWHPDKPRQFQLVPSTPNT